jgi:hypothetical protein
MTIDECKKFDGLRCRVSIPGYGSVVGTVALDDSGCVCVKNDESSTFRTFPKSIYIEVIVSTVTIPRALAEKVIATLEDESRDREQRATTAMTASIASLERVGAHGIDALVTKLRDAMEEAPNA